MYVTGQDPQDGMPGDGEPGTKIPDGQKAHEEWVPNDVELKAQAGGWRPLEDWDGAEDEWVSAKDFNFRGELMQRITKQGRTIATVEQQLAEARTLIAASDRVTQRLIKETVDKTRRELRAQKREAISDDDHQLADSIDDQLEELKAAQDEIRVEQTSAPAAPAGRQPTPVEAAWFTLVSTTEWAQDPVLNPKLLQFAESVRAGDPGISVGDFMEKVLDKGKELRGLKRPAPPPGPDEGKGGKGRGNTRRGASKGFSASDLNEQQTFIGKGYVDDGIMDSLDDYAKALGEAGGIDK